MSIITKLVKVFVVPIVGLASSWYTFYSGLTLTDAHTVERMAFLIIGAIIGIATGVWISMQVLQLVKESEGKK